MLKSKFYILKQYIYYYWRAKTKYNIHSPFVFDFIQNILEDDRFYYAFDDIEFLRRQLLDNQSIITVEDYGAGAHRKSENNRRKISDIAQRVLTPPDDAQFLFRLVHHYKPKVMIELGTSLGISTLYHALALPKSAVITLEGCQNIANIARQNFNYLKAKNIKTIVGNFDDTFSTVLNAYKTIDYVFIDGNHRKEPTLRYFEQCLEKINEHTILVFDDIHWSEEMTDAWNTLRQHPSVRLSIDIFRFGIPFFRNEQREPEHFTLIEHHKKPWKSGLLNT